MKSKLFRRFFLVGFFSILLTFMLLSSVFYKSWHEDFARGLREEAQILAIMNNEKPINNQNISDIKKLLNNDLRITIISPEGKVLFDSYVEPKGLENHKNRPEVKAAMENGYGEIERQSNSLHESNYYCAVRCDNGEIVRVSRVGVNIYYYILAVLPIAIFLLLLLIIASYLGAWYLSKNIVDPLNRIVKEWSNEEGEASDIEKYKEIKPLLEKLITQKQTVNRAFDNLNEERLRLRSILSTISEGVLLLDDRGIAKEYNERMRKFLGIEKYVRIIGQSGSDLCNNVEWRKGINEIINGQTAHKYEFDRLGKHYRISMTAITAASSESLEITTGILIVVFDRTLDYTETQRRREFSSNISHELKTPLTTISGYSEVLANHFFKSEEEAIKLGKRIYDASQRMLNLIESIMHLSRVEAYDSHEQWTRLSLRTLASDCWERLRSKWEKYDISFSIDGDAECMAQGALMGEVFINLMDNAIKFSKGHNNITFKLQEDEKEVIITCKDTGRGIDPVKLDRVFERFYREEESRSVTEGTGIGLSLVKHIVTLHGGKIKLESTLGKGSKFIIRLPKGM